MYTLCVQHYHLGTLKSVHTCELLVQKECHLTVSGQILLLSCNCYLNNSGHHPCTHCVWYLMLSTLDSRFFIFFFLGLFFQNSEVDLFLLILLFYDEEQYIWLCGVGQVVGPTNQVLQGHHICWHISTSKDENQLIKESLRSNAKGQNK